MKETRGKDHPEATGGRAQRMLDATPAILCVVDMRERRLTAHNAALARALGCSDEELSTRGLAALSARIHPDDLAGLAARAERLSAARDGEVVDGELRAQGREGDERLFAVRAEVFTRGEDGAAREIFLSAEDVTERRRLLRSEALLAAFCERAPVLLYAKDGDGAFLLVSRSLEEVVGAAPGSMVGKTDKDFFPPDVAAIYNDVDALVRSSGAPFEAEDPVPHPGGEKTYFTIKFPVWGEGIPEGSMAGVSLDITRVKEAEREREAARDELIAAQQDTIRELVTPLLPIAEGVLVMPLIGFFDSARAGRIIETLLEGVERHAARIAIIDITGVKAVDERVAEMLVQAARAAGLLGAEVVLTGIQPAIARTMIELDIDLRGLVTEGTLQGGIAYALKRR
ncbi:PAS domain-containing protein [Sorangium cellulosum]|uniref:Anti-anti-sigma factor n=1 Tax=Sorangium cellulosum So0157-2 TaxID=1254432 RepID=S4XNB3_SORCE|nr:PAS domain-containing protein [Sorangium cellulosum]AGP34044.1 anti-anti-sigma factor [Sorangium cellulosum So0157-2]